MWLSFLRSCCLLSGGRGPQQSEGPPGPLMHRGVVCPKASASFSRVQGPRGLCSMITSPVGHERFGRPSSEPCALWPRHSRCCPRAMATSQFTCWLQSLTPPWIPHDLRAGCPCWHAWGPGRATSRKPGECGVQPGREQWMVLPGGTHQHPWADVVHFPWESTPTPAPCPQRSGPVSARRRGSNQTQYLHSGQSSKAEVAGDTGTTARGPR